MTTRDAKGQFVKGKSGNPKGRPRVSGLTRTSLMRAYCEAHTTEVLPALVEEAKRGDVAAARLLTDIVIPRMRPTDTPVQLRLPKGGLGKRAETVLRAIAAGKISPGEGRTIIEAMVAAERAAEIDEREKMLREIEERNDDKGPYR